MARSVAIALPPMVAPMNVYMAEARAVANISAALRMSSAGIQVISATFSGV
jgi:hypothetical protein